MGMHINAMMDCITLWSSHAIADLAQPANQLGTRLNVHLGSVGIKKHGGPELYALSFNVCYRLVMNKVKNLQELVSLSKADLTSILDNDSSAELLWNFLHSELQVHSNVRKS